MRIGVPGETHAGERRVATTPEVASHLIKMGVRVAVRRAPARERVTQTTRTRPQAAKWSQAAKSCGPIRT